MRDYVPHFIALAGLGMILGTIVYLAHSGQQMDTLGAIGLGTALGTAVTGISPSFSRSSSQHTPAQITNVNAPKESTTVNNSEKATTTGEDNK